MIVRGPAWLETLDQGQKDRLAQGLSIVLGDRVYAVCRGCMTVIWMNKPLVGSLHLCSEERAAEERRKLEDLKGGDLL